MPSGGLCTNPLSSRATSRTARAAAVDDTLWTFSGDMLTGLRLGPARRQREEVPPAGEAQGSASVNEPHAPAPALTQRARGSDSGQCLPESEEEGRMEGSGRPSSPKSQQGLPTGGTQ